MKKRKRKSANLSALSGAATRAATAFKRPPSSPLIIPRAPARSPAINKRAFKNYKELVSSPRQTGLLKQRAATTRALQATSVKKRRDPLLLDKSLREAICNDYQRDRKKRRSSMFAKSSAGKGHRNTGKKTPDWRAEYCK